MRKYAPALALLLAPLLFACAATGDVIIPAGGSQAIGTGVEAAAGMATAGSRQSADTAQPETSAAPSPSPGADAKPPAQYATAEEFAKDMVLFPFQADAFPARLDAAAKRFGSGIACPELTYSELSEGYFGAITDTVFIHLHTPGGEGLYEISVGEIGGLAGKAAPHDAFLQAALSVLGAAGDLTQDQAMGILDALHAAEPAAGKAYAHVDQDGFRVTMEVRDGVDLRLAVHRLTPREGKLP